MGKVHRRGTAVVAKQVAKRHRRNCRSAPEVPTGLTLGFARREMGRIDRWRAVARWDPVTEDVAGRALTIEGYQAQLRATDASGEPVETNLQAEAAIESGAGFTVHAGSAAVNGISRELNASPDEIKKTLTGLTVGIECAVNFYAKEDLVGSAPRLRFKIWNVTNNVEVVAKNETLESLSPRIYATLPFTPVVGKTYEARVAWVSGSGIGLLETIQWHDRGAAAQWTQMVPDDEDPLAALWAGIPRPKTWYFQTRVRTLNRHQGQRCWSAWTAWTTPTIPATGALSGPPAPTGLVLSFDKVEAMRGRAWRAKGRVNQSPQWTPPDGEPTDVDDYVFQLQVSSESDGTPLLNTRRGLVVEHDPEQTYARQEWRQILGKRYYRVRAKARSLGRAGAFTSWTAWASPGGAPDPPTGLTWSNPTPARFVARWTDPADMTDVDRYRVQVIRANDSSVVEDGSTTTNKWSYDIPKADRGINHRARVRSIEDPGGLDVDEDTPVGWDSAGEESSLVTSSDVADATPIYGTIINDNDDPIIRPGGKPRCKLRYTSGQNIADNTNTFIRWGTTETDTDNFYPTTTDNLNATPDADYEITLPFDGQYDVILNCTYATDATGRRINTLMLNGVAYEATSMPGVGGGAAILSCPSVVDAVAGDKLTCRVFQQTGGLLALSSARLTVKYDGNS